jgi:hypothetical protein
MEHLLLVVSASVGGKELYRTSMLGTVDEIMQSLEGYFGSYPMSKFEIRDKLQSANAQNPQPANEDR